MKDQKYSHIYTVAIVWDWGAILPEIHAHTSRKAALCDAKWYAENYKNSYVVSVIDHLKLGMTTANRKEIYHHEKTHEQ